MIKNGIQYIVLLCDGWQVYLNGQLVGDVIVYVVFCNLICSYVSLYDYQVENENVEKMMFVLFDFGNCVSWIW